MGPASRSSDRSDLPSHPRFTWTPTKVPWTDGVGPQHRYEEAVKHWCKFHDMLPANNPNKIQPNMRGIMLMQGLFGRARDLVRSIPEDDVYGDNGPDKIVKVINKRDALAKLTTFFSDFLTLITLRRGENEAYKNFESRFAATAYKFNENNKALVLPEPMLACLLLHTSSVEENNKISILSSVSAQISTTDAEVAAGAKEDLLDIKYESVAKILRQCERPRVPQAPLSANTGNPTRNGGGGGSGRGGGGKRYTPSKLKRAKGRHACHFCKSKGIIRYGHWADDHNPDGSLPDGVPSTEKRSNGPNANSGNASNSNNNNNKDNNDKNNPSNKDKDKDMYSFTSSINCSTAWSSGHILSAASVDEQTLLPSGKIGPLVDDGAPYSAIGETELHSIRHLLIDSSPKIESKPQQFVSYDQWQYGEGIHASRPKKILGSVKISVRTDGNNIVNIRHMLISGSSSWVIGRDLTRRCSIERFNGNALRLPFDNDDQITMTDDEFHSRIAFERFWQKVSPSSSPSLRALTAAPNPTRHVANWKSTRRIVDRVHKHVCGHASFSDIRTLLMRNGMWSCEAQKYLVEKVNECTHCKASSTPPPNRRVSLASLDREFNSVVAIDLFFLDEIIIFHAMDTATRYSAALLVPSTSMRDSIFAFEASLLSQFWPPSAIHADGAFQTREFRSFLNKWDIELRSVPPRRHQKNMIEPRHGVIRSISLRLRQADSATSHNISALQAVRISNDLYGNDVASAFELAKGFTRPINNDADLLPLPNDIGQAHYDLLARRKLNLILRSHAQVEKNLNKGDFVQIYIKLDAEKRGSWTSPRQVLDIDTDGGFITTAGRAGKVVRAALEDVRIAPQVESLDSVIQEATDDLENRIHDMLLEYDLADKANSTSSDDINDDNDADQGSNSDSIDNAADDQDEVDDDQSDVDDHDESDESDASPPAEVSLPSVGDRIQVYWPLDDTYYYGEVKHFTKKGLCYILYDDDATEELDLSKETWRPERVGHAATGSFLKTLTSNEQEVLTELMNTLGQRPFLHHHAQGFDQAVMHNAYKEEETKYLRHVKVVRRNRSSVPPDANIIASHTVYKIKTKDDDDLKLKARIAPHGNEDSDTELLKSDCAMCPPIGIRITITVSTVKRWKIVRVDVETAFHQSGPATRKVYVIPPRESGHRGVLWLLLVAGYGLINAGAKWKTKSDDEFHDMGLRPVAVIPQLFGFFDGDELLLLVIKIVDDILLTGTDERIEWFIKRFGQRFKLGEIEYGLGQLRFFGMTLTQHDDYSCTMHTYYKLNALDPYPISRIRRHQESESLNNIELSSFKSLNSSLSWLGTVASPLCAFYSSHLQQRFPDCTVHDLTTQPNALALLKRHGTLSTYLRPKTGSQLALNVVAFADASHRSDRSQLCYLIGLVFG